MSSMVGVVEVCVEGGKVHLQIQIVVLLLNQASSCKIGLQFSV